MCAPENLPERRLYCFLWRISPGITDETISDDLNVLKKSVRPLSRQFDPEIKAGEAVRKSILKG